MPGRHRPWHPCALCLLAGLAILAAAHVLMSLRDEARRAALAVNISRRPARARRTVKKVPDGGSTTRAAPGCEGLPQPGAVALVVAVGVWAVALATGEACAPGRPPSAAAV